LLEAALPEARLVTSKVMQTREEYSLHPIGHIRSTLRALGAAPRQGSEGAPDAWFEVDPTFARALSGIVAGDQVIVITWLDRADRAVLEVHPRGDPKIPLAGVFATRSPHRPNPLGLHRVIVREMSGTRLRIGPIEAIGGTPVVDVKPVLVDCANNIARRQSGGDSNMPLVTGATSLLICRAMPRAVQLRQGSTKVSRV
jgi:tRNA-Thr(GGU) m(6)t(6)A37 methyltransferase TsaA